MTPAFHKDDALVAFSGSGKTKSVLEACETYKTDREATFLLLPVAESH